MKTIKITLIILAIAFSGNLFAKPHYIIEMVKFKNGEINISTYVDELKDVSRAYHGRLIVNPIHVVGQMKTDVTPEYTSDFNFDYILIIRFESKKEAKDFSEDNRTKNFRKEQETLIKTQSIVLSKSMMALPGMPKFAEINNEVLRQDSSFILVNAIKMKKTPGAMMKMMKYFKRNYPTITENGTHYFSTLKVAKVLEGEFDFQMLFLTEWESEAAFQRVHNLSSFKENVHLRNTSFTKFTEGKGVINLE